MQTIEQIAADIARAHLRAEIEQSHSRPELISHHLESSGNAPTRIFTVWFIYDDGTMRGFDGKNWRTQ